MRTLLSLCIFVMIIGGSTLLHGGSTAQATCAETTGRTERTDFYASVIQTRIYFTVYLPACYDATLEKTYPVVYLMHGSNDDDGQWGRLGLYDVLDEGISTGVYPPVIAVMPFAEWVGNENRFDAASWNAVFMEELLPLAEDLYRIDPDQRAIGGISRGGFWAFHLAFRFPQMFHAVGGHSAFFDRFHAAPEFNPLNLATDAPGIDALHIALDRGADDYAAPGLEIMNENLAARGVDYTYTVHPQGQHNNTYWSAHVAEYMDFYLAAWPAQAEPTPTATPTLETPSDPAENNSIFVTNTPRPRADMGILATPSPAATATPAGPIARIAPTTDPALLEQGAYLLLPAVVFPSRQANISAERLNNLRAGVLDASLVVSVDVANTLATEFDLALPEGTRVVAADALYNTLNRDRTLYTLLPFDQLTVRWRVLWVDEVHPLDRDLSAYPFAFPTSVPNFFPARLTRIALSGVTALTRSTIPVLDREGLDWAASGILDYVTAPDYFHTSNEVSFHPDCPAYVQGRLGAFCSKQSHFELFDILDLDIVELSGNHNNDYGYDAYLETLQWYIDREIAVIAGGETLADAQSPLIIEHNGNSIALLSCNWPGPYYAHVNEDPNLLGGVRPGAAACDMNWLREVLPVLSASHDQVILTMQHWEFDQYTPSPQQRTDFRTLAELGADVVVGTHSHFPQVFEFANGADPGEEAFLHYGLGNIFFDQQFFGGVRFFIDQLFIYEGRLLTVDLFTGIIEGQGRPRPMTPDERENFLFLIFTQYGGM